MSPGSSALLLEQLAIVYSLPHWHSKCIPTVLSHNQQVAIFMHVKAEGKLFMGDWTWEKWAASSKTGLRWEHSFFYRLLNRPDHGNIRVYYSAFHWEKRCPARQPSAPRTLWCIWDMLPFRIRLKSYFSMWAKLNGRGRGDALLHPTIKVFTPGSLQQRHEKQEENIEAKYKDKKTPKTVCECLDSVENGRNGSTSRGVGCGECGGWKGEQTFTCVRNYSRASGVQMWRWDVRGMWCQTPAAARWKECHLLGGREGGRRSAG